MSSSSLCRDAGRDRHRLPLAARAAPPAPAPRRRCRDSARRTCDLASPVTVRAHAHRGEDRLGAGVAERHALHARQLAHQARRLRPRAASADRSRCRALELCARPRRMTKGGEWPKKVDAVAHSRGRCTRSRRCPRASSRRARSATIGIDDLLPVACGSPAPCAGRPACADSSASAPSTPACAASRARSARRASLLLRREVALHRVLRDRLPRARRSGAAGTGSPSGAAAALDRRRLRSRGWRALTQRPATGPGPAAPRGTRPARSATASSPSAGAS